MPSPSGAFHAGGLHWFDAWYGLFSYAFQIYFDFSGYSDMAVGLALMLGFSLIKNFDSPYQAVSITDLIGANVASVFASTLARPDSAEKRRNASTRLPAFT